MNEPVIKDTNYSVEIFINKNIFYDDLLGFEAKQIVENKFVAMEMFSTKNEAIEAVIKKLESLKE